MVQRFDTRWLLFRVGREIGCAEGSEECTCLKFCMMRVCWFECIYFVGVCRKDVDTSIRSECVV